jgi:hypothetical protein
MESPGNSGPQFLLLALVAILVVAVVAVLAIAVINSNDEGGPGEPTPILPPILPTDPGSSYNLPLREAGQATIRWNPHAGIMAAVQQA